MKVSVNIVTRNRAGYLRRAIESVLMQDYKDLELVVVDDGSSDGTWEVIESYKKQIELKAFCFSKNVGVVRARQKALDISTGELVAVLDDDDEWISKSKVSMQVDRFLKNSKLVLVGCYGELVDDLTGKIYYWQPPITDKDIRQQMLLRNSFMHPAMMFKKDKALAAGGYAENIRYSEDYALVLKLGLMGEMEVVPEFLIRFRLNHQGLTSLNNLKQIITGIVLIWKYRRDYPNILMALPKWSLHCLFVFLFGSQAWFKFTKWKNKEKNEK